MYFCLNFLTIKPTRCTNFSNLFWKWNSTCFGQFLCPYQQLFTVHSTMAYVTQVLRQSLSSFILILLLESCLQTCMTYTIVECTVNNCWYGQRNCPKHVEFQFQNKFEKLVHLVGFIIRKFVTMHGHANVKFVGWSKNCTPDARYVHKNTGRSPQFRHKRHFPRPYQFIK
jgi:hypothetical protein